VEGEMGARGLMVVVMQPAIVLVAVVQLLAMPI
jgi:hypothetical protein